MDTPKAPILLELFDRAIPRLFFDQLRERLGMPARGIYSLAVVVWLMMWQRLDNRGSLSTAVQQVEQGALGDLVPSEKRVIERRVSGNTGALSRAQKRLQLPAVEAVCDEVFAAVRRNLQGRLVLLGYCGGDGPGAHGR